jgi:general secretion pathway protein D
MSTLLRTAVVLAVMASGAAPMTVLASPVAAQRADAPARSAPPPATTPGSPAPSEPATALDFHDADIATVVQAVSEIVGFSYVLAPDVRGTVTVRTSGTLRREAVFAVFLSVLEVHGFTAVKAGDLYKIVRTETARQRAIPTFIAPPPPPAGAGPPPATAAPPDQPVTQVLVPRFASALMLAGVVRPLVSVHGHLVAHPQANALVVTDTAENVGRIAEVVERLDIALAAEEVHVIRLRYADARHLAGLLNQVFAGVSLARPPVIVADRRTNSLVIRARRSDLETIGRLLRE